MGAKLQTMVAKTFGGEEASTPLPDATPLAKIIDGGENMTTPAEKQKGNDKERIGGKAYPVTRSSAPCHNRNGAAQLTHGRLTA